MARRRERRHDHAPAAEAVGEPATEEAAERPSVESV
jgi:hypothetical protein